MDNLAEFCFFRDSMARLTVFKVISQVMLVAYLVFFVSKMVLLPQTEGYIIWQNFEGVVVYSALCLLTWTLSKYAQAKQIDLQ